MDGRYIRNLSEVSDESLGMIYKETKESFARHIKKFEKER